MDNEEMSKALDEMLDQVDQKMGDGGHIPSLPEDGTTADMEYEIPELEEVDIASFDDILAESGVRKKQEFKPPILPEMDQEPLNINPKEDVILAPSFKKEDSKKIPNFDDIKANSVGDSVIAKKSRIGKIDASLWKKIKDVIKKTLMVIIALIALYGVVGRIPHDLAVNSYVDNSKALQKMEMVDRNGEPIRVKMDDLGRDIGRAIADELIIHDLMNTDKSYSINKAIIKYIGVTFDTVSSSAGYTKGGAMGERNPFFKIIDSPNNERDNNWMNIVYDSLAKRLRDENIIDLPETFEEYLKANGFYNGKMSYNVYTNEFKRDSNGEVDNKGALINLSAYANYLIGREKNPEDKVSKEFYKILEKFKEFFGDFKVTYDQDGVHVTDEKGDDVYLLKGSDGSNNFVSIESPIIWSNKGR